MRHSEQYVTSYLMPHSDIAWTTARSLSNCATVAIVDRFWHIISGCHGYHGYIQHLWRGRGKCIFLKLLFRSWSTHLIPVLLLSIPCISEALYFSWVTLWFIDVGLVPVCRATKEPCPVVLRLIQYVENSLYYCGRFSPEVQRSLYVMMPPFFAFPRLAP